MQSENVERIAAEATSNDAALFPWLRTQAHTKTDEGYFLSDYVLLLFLLNLRKLLGSVFDGVVELLKRMKEDLLRRLVEAVMFEVKAKFQPYRLDKFVDNIFFFF